MQHMDGVWIFFLSLFVVVWAIATHPMDTPHPLQLHAQTRAHIHELTHFRIYLMSDLTRESLLDECADWKVKSDDLWAQHYNAVVYHNAPKDDLEDLQLALYETLLYCQIAADMQAMK